MSVSYNRLNCKRNDAQMLTPCHTDDIKMFIKGNEDGFA